MPASTGVLRHSRSDAVLIALSFAHAGLLMTFPSSPLIALGLWWNANTISHNFVHLPFFRAPALNGLYSIYLTLLLSIPHSVWRERHLRHHSGRASSFRLTRVACVETGLIAALWAGLASLDSHFFVAVFLPGYLVGLGLCHMQGYFEHARGTTSHYGRLYNFLFFNDGYHVEHHQRSSEHWTALPRHSRLDAPHSRWPPVLRWLDSINLEALEHLVLRSTRLQRYVVACHERAFRSLLGELPEIRRVTIVGGGLFPRTALVLLKVLPAASLTIVDASAANLELASTFLNGAIDLRHRTYRLLPESQTDERDEPDLVVIPLAFIGDRDLLYRAPPAPRVLVHDWIWKPRAQGVTVSWFLLKRLNLVIR
jgi:fatty acid desaturase